MSTKFTQGEWKLRIDNLTPPLDGCKVGRILDYKGDTIAKVTACHKSKGEANAKLIAAAPELLEALMEIKHAMIDDQDISSDERLYSLVFDAIKNATS